MQILTAWRSEVGALLKPTDVAARWQCSGDHVRKLCRTGRLRAMRLGTDWRLSLTDVEAYEAAHMTDVTPKVTLRHLASHPTLSVVPSDMDGALPYGWWESTTTTVDSSSTGRSRSADTKKARSAAN